MKAGEVLVHGRQQTVVTAMQDSCPVALLPCAWLQSVQKGACIHHHAVGRNMQAH